MMKIFTLFFVTVFTFTLLPAQSVGIGTTTPDKSAALDINVSSLPANNKKGVLLPRVALLHNTDVTTIPAPAIGLAIYNTTNNGSGTSAVFADTFYFWDGAKWIDIANITTVKNELLPQVYFIAESTNGVTSPQSTVSGTDNINVAPVVVKYSASSQVMNTGNNITFIPATYHFKVNNTASYEVSGFVSYNPFIGVNASTNIEFIIQRSTDGGTNWTNLAKTTGVWGYGTASNSRTNNVAPIIVNLNANDLLRSVVFKTLGTNHGASSQMLQATGLKYIKVLKIQRLN